MKCRVCGQPLRIIEDITDKNTDYRKYIVACQDIDKHDITKYNATVKVFFVYDKDAELSDYYDEAYKSRFQEFIIKNHKLYLKK